MPYFGIMSQCDTMIDHINDKCQVSQYWQYLGGFFFISDLKEPLFKSAVPDFTRHIVVEPVIYKNNDKLVSTFSQVSHLFCQLTVLTKRFVESLGM